MSVLSELVDDLYYIDVRWEPRKGPAAGFICGPFLRVVSHDLVSEESRFISVDRGMSADRCLDQAGFVKYCTCYGFGTHINAGIRKGFIAKDLWCDVQWQRSLVPPGDLFEKSQKLALMAIKKGGHSFRDQRGYNTGWLPSGLAVAESLKGCSMY